MTSLKKRWLNPFPVAAGQDFISSHYPVNNFLRNDLTGMKVYGYGGGHQYRGSSGTGHCYCPPRYYLLGGTPTSGLIQSRQETYSGWDNIVGKISTNGFFRYVFNVIFTSRVTNTLRIDRAQRRSQFLLKLANNNQLKNSTTSLILTFSNIKHRSTRDGPSASASATGDCSANGTGH